MPDLPFSSSATKMVALLPMNERYTKWYTPWLSREFEMLVFGDRRGLPLGIIIGTGEWDVTRDESFRLSRVLNSKGTQHWLDDGRWRGHDWNYWQDMLPYYLSLL